MACEWKGAMRIHLSVYALHATTAPPGDMQGGGHRQISGPVQTLRVSSSWGRAQLAPGSDLASFFVAGGGAYTPFCFMPRPGSNGTSKIETDRFCWRRRPTTDGRGQGSRGGGKAKRTT